MRKTRKNTMKGRTAVQRLLSLALCLVMCGQMLPVTTAYADETTRTETAAEEQESLFQKLLGGIVETAQADNTPSFNLNELDNIMTTWVNYDGAVIKAYKATAGKKYTDNLNQPVSDWDSDAYRWMDVFSGNLMFPGGRLARSITGGNDGIAVSNTISGGGAISAKMQNLIDCLEAGGTLQSGNGNCNDLTTLKMKLSGYISTIQPLFGDDRCLGSNTKSGASRAEMVISEWYMKLTMHIPDNKMRVVVDTLNTWTSEAQKAIMLAQEIMDCAYMADGHIVISPCGAETTAEAAKANMERYRQAIIDCNKYSWNVDSAYDPIVRYKLSLNRYCQICLEQGSAEAVAAASMLSELNKTRSAEIDKFTAAQSGLSGQPKDRLAGVVTDITSAAKPIVDQLELVMKNDPSYISVDVMSYADAKKKVDDAYAELNGVMLSAAKILGHTADDNISVQEAEDYMRDSGGQFFFVVDKRLEELKSALMTMVMGTDEKGKPHLERYASDLHDAIVSNRIQEGFYATPKDLASLLAIQMTDLYTGEWKIKGLTLGNHSAQGTITHQLLEELSFEPSVTYNNIVTDIITPIINITPSMYAYDSFKAAYEGLESILREVAQQAVIQTVIAENGVNIHSNQDMLDYLRANAQAKEDIHLTRMGDWRDPDSKQVSKMADYSATSSKAQHVKECAKGPLYSLLAWRTAQEAYHTYLTYSAAWETLPGVAAIELTCYKTSLMMYADMIEEWRNRYTGIHIASAYKPSVKEAYQQFNSFTKEYMAIQIAVLESITEDETLQEQTQQAKSYQSSRLDPYSDEALAIVAAQGTDLRTYLRLQLAELRVWDAILKRSLEYGNGVAAKKGWGDMVNDALTSGGEECPINDFVKFMHAYFVWGEAEFLYPLVHQYLQEAEKQYNKYNYTIDVSEEIQGESLPTTDKSPEEMKELLAANEAEITALDDEYSAAQEELDRCIEYLGTESAQYEELLAEVNAVTERLNAAKEEHDALQVQLIYACLNYSDGLIDMINGSNEIEALKATVSGLNIEELMEKVRAEMKPEDETLPAEPEITVYDIYLYVLKEKVKELGGDPAEIIANPTPDSKENKVVGEDEVERSRTLEDYADAMLNLVDFMESYNSGSARYAPFPDFNLLEEDDLRRAIQDYQAEIEEIYKDTENQYNSMLTAYALYERETELTEKAWQYQNVVTIAQNYVGTTQRVQDLYTAVAQAEYALQRLAPPATEEEAEQRFKEAFMKWYYARREYLEFEELEINLFEGENTALSSNYVSDSQHFHILGWKTFYQAIINNTDTRASCEMYQQLSRLKSAYDAAEKALLGDKSNPNDKDYAAYYLGSREISKEVLLTGDALSDRIALVKSERDQAKKSYEAIKKSLRFVESLRLDNKNNYTDIYQGTVAHAQNRMNVLSTLQTLEKTSDMYNFVYSSSNEEFIAAYLNYEMCEARAADPDGIRESIMERAEVMADKYALQVDTGATPGTGKILFFSVDYTDKDGFKRKEYIFPNLDAEKKTNDMVNALTDTSKVLNQSHVTTMAKLGQSGSSALPTRSLDSWNTDTFLFTSQYTMTGGDLLGFEAFGQNVHTAQSYTPGDGMFSNLFETKNTAAGQNKESSNSWSCRGMRVYHVDDIYGGSVYGYGGSDQTRTKLEFIGQQIGALNKFNYSVSWSCDKMFHFDEKMKEFSIDRDTYDYKTEKVGEGSAAGRVKVRSDEESEYLFKLDIADVYGAGVEPLVTRYQDNGHTASSGSSNGTALQAAGTTVQPCTIQDLGLAECLVYTIVYYDGNDCRHIVRVPVITSSMAWAVDHGISMTDSIFGYAQQGDSLVFSAYLPDMQSISLEESFLRFEAVEGWASSSQASQKSRTNISQRINMLKETVAQERTLSDGTKTTEMVPRDGEVRLTGMQIYKPGTYSASVEMDNGVIKPTVEGNPAYYFVSAGTSGESYAYGEDVYLTNLLENYTEGTALKPKADGNKYMVLIHTDFTSLSATADSPTVSVEYVTLSGRVVSSAAEDVATTSHDYYGYWPGVNNEDITSVMATGQNGELKMLFEINDLNYFNKIKIAMDSTARDDWQITKIEIKKIDSLGQRVGTWTPVEKNVTGTILSDRTYDRILDGQTLLSKEEKVLIQPGDTKEILIRGDNAQVEEQEDIDWEEKRFYMDLDTAMTDLGFNKQRANYTVKVKVAGETDANTIDGDCGSVNPFYFQLVFANGKSGYVLANQQLSGDGFRTGYNETFTMCTNRDYGDLKSVRIIPDDMSSTSDTFDKLNIDSIEVSRQSNEAVNRTWVINDVGWIKFDYHDEAESYSVSGRDGRAEGSIARNFNVSYSTYSTKLLFAIQTDPPPANSDQISELMAGQSATVQKQIREALTAQRQFQGEVKLNLTYRDSKGNVQHETFDMVQAMAAYANKKIVTQESTDENGEIDQSETVSDTSYMFRMGHTDRFELEIRDAVQLLNASIIATGVADQSCFWKVSEFAVSMITEAGMLNINDNNEYEKTNAASAEKVTKSTGLPYTLWVPARQTEEFQFYFEDNEINVDLDDETWEVAATRVPDSDNDVANVYVYLTDDSKMPDALMALIRYANSYGLSYQAAQREMLPMPSAKGFYANSIDVSGMSILNKLVLDTLDAGTRDVTIDHVVIQQVRSDVVINTYTCYLSEIEGSMSDGGKLTIYPGGTTNQGGSGITYNENKQVVTLGFGDNTETARLVAENRDIAVAIRYTTTNDANGREYNSPYIYLTDQQIQSIAAGSTAQITFHEPYVNTIKGIVLLATGKLQAEFRMGSVGVYEKDAVSGKDTCLRWYSFGGETGNVVLKVDPRMFRPSADNALDTIKNKLYTVCPLTVSFTTGTTEMAIDTQTNDPIRMVVSYVDAEGNSQTRSFADIRNMLIGGGFGAGETATVRVMLMGVKTLTGISVEPYSSSSKVISTDDWYISSFSLEMNQETNVYSHSAAVRRSAVQGTAVTMNASAVKLSVEASTTSAAGTTRFAYSDAGPIDLTVKPSQEVKLTPTLTGTSKGCSVQTICLTDGFDASDVIKEVSGSYVFKTTETEKTYRVIFTSDEDSTVSETVTITVTTSGDVEPQETYPFGFVYFNALTQSYESIHDVTINVGSSVTVKTGTSDYPADALQWNFGKDDVATLDRSSADHTVTITGAAPGDITYVVVGSNGKTETFKVHVKNPAESA